ncbi:MAG: potassium transporter TrkG [Faecalimonas umbilicata]|uniref:TrkH family potassium uptake protein n=1 Tax=Faecalimonas umbilicata TaxID=1912855 RepID=UPI002A7541DC|nr:potassium transporter TrkG [Faecalimonas umbilicata]MDY2762933.1 potassium transporter TrkG [Faecalimonas umbilicata]
MDVIQKKSHFSSPQMIIFGFILVNLMGCLLLMLPSSTVEKVGTSFSDALFTSTSAICVTGLVIHDTASHWSMQGQLIIMVLIQIGGMGVITAASAIAILSGKKIGLMQRSTMQESISATQVGGIVRLTGFILRAMLAIELLGAICMAPVFCEEFGMKKGVWYAVFHSVSAFCNAGFDLMGVNQPFSSLTGFNGNTTINLAIMALIVIGGIGFLTWDDIWHHRLHFHKYRLQSKVILTVTILLILLPALYFYFYEFGRAEWTDLSEKERILASAFQSVTPRTAGFNTVDLNRMSEPSQLIMILLMLIGGSPGSTAGGFKTTTLAVLLLTSFAVFFRKEDVQCFGRRIPSETVKNAATILFLYMSLFLLGGVVISCVDQVPLMGALFETSSAIGTVGLSLGLTPQLSLFSHMLLIILMFWGRVGGLTLIFAVVSGHRFTKSKLPQEKITIG